MRAAQRSPAVPVSVVPGAPVPGAPVIGHPLAYVRHRRGWSYAALLAEIARSARAQGLPLGELDRAKAHRWETRGVVPEPAVQWALARVLGVPHGVARERPWPGWLPAYGGFPALESWSAGSAVEVLSGAVAGGPGDPRGYLGCWGPGLAAAARGWSDADPVPVTAVAAGPLAAGPGLLGALAGQAALLRRTGPALPLPLAGELAWAQLRLARELLAAGHRTAAQSQRLYLVVAELAHYAGWAAHDTGRHFAAQRYWWAGAQAAHCLGDRPLAAYLLLAIGHQAVRLGDTGAGLRLSEHAARAAWRDASPAARALLAGHLGLVQLAAGQDPRRVHAAARAAAGPARQNQRETGPPPGWPLVPVRTGWPEPWLEWCARSGPAGWPGHGGRRVVLLDGGHRVVTLAGHRWPVRESAAWGLAVPGQPPASTPQHLHQLAVQFAAAAGPGEAARLVRPGLRRLLRAA
jgi:hypothetical protein